MRVGANGPWPDLLALLSGPTPHMMAHALHAAVAIEAVLPDGTRHAATAIVEEISRGPVSERDLLLGFGTSVALPVGSEIWLTQAPLPGNSFTTNQ